jgi:hypothetical protein
VQGLPPATGFWSYAHTDDQAMSGHVLELADEVRNAFQMISSETITIFVDRHSIVWGEEWRSKISTSILGTTFFFPVITPSYLRSPNCRDEFEQFWDKAKTSNLRGLLLPILYEDIDLVNSTDPICQIVREIQYSDWTTAKLEEKTSSVYRKLLHKMGKRLVEVAYTVTNTPDPEPDEDEGGGGGQPPGPAGGDSSREDQESAGLLDVWVDAESLTARFTEQMQAALDALRDVLTPLQREQPPPNASPGQRLFHVNAVSQQMRQPAVDFEREARSLVQATRELTNVIMTVAEYFSDPLFSANVPKAALDLSKLRLIPDLVALKFGQYDVARNSVASLGRMSRQMKEPVSAVERGFDSLDAVREMLSSWITTLEPFAADNIQASSSEPSNEKE